MSDPALRLSRVDERAREIVGDREDVWMVKPSRQLSRLMPRDLAKTSNAGMKVVQTELERTEVVLRRWARD